MIDTNIFENIIKTTYNLPNLPSNDKSNYESYYGESEDIIDENLEVMCSNCNEFVPEDYGKDTEHDGFICEQCLKDGFGQ